MLNGTNITLMGTRYPYKIVAKTAKSTFLSTYLLLYPMKSIKQEPISQAPIVSQPPTPKIVKHNLIYDGVGGALTI